MEALLPEVSWRQLFVAAIVLWLFYYLVQWLGNRLRRMSLKKATRLLLPVSRFMMAFYEPVAAIILLGIFFLINPLLHGILIAVLIVLGFSHLKNYVSGRLVQLGFDWQIGNQLEVAQVNGVITRLGRLGIYLQDSEGQHYIGYARLLADGYTLLSNEDAGGFFNLDISLPEGGSLNQHYSNIMNRLIKAPYLDWSHLPVVQAEESSRSVSARIFVNEEKQLPELLLLIKEWGYPCEVTNKK